MNMTVKVFYANLVYAELVYNIGKGGGFFTEASLHDLPDGCIFKFHKDMEMWWPGLWYRSDLTPMLPKEVPKELLTLLLLLN